MSIHCLRAFGALLLLACVPAAAIAADTADTANSADPGLIPINDFARFPRVMSPHLSPDGSYLEVRMDDEAGELHSLVILKVSDMSVVNIMHMPKYELPFNVRWVGPTRLVMEKGKSFGSLTMPVGTGEIIATDIDGRNQKYLFGYKPVGRRATTRQADYASGEFAGRPEKANGHFFLQAYSWKDDNLSTLYDIDAVHNTRHLLVDMHISGMDFLVDPKGQPTFASGTDANFHYVVYRKLATGWAPLDFRNGVSFTPFAYAPDGHTVYATLSTNNGPAALVSQHEDGSDRQILAMDGFSNIGNIEWTPFPEQPFAAVPDAGIPTPVFINANLPAAKLYRALQKSFPGEFVDFLNYSDDGGMLLFSVSSDRDPGTYYLIDTHTFKLRKLFAAEPWIDPAKMAERRPFRFKASDGMELEGYLTLPPKRGETNLPMVLLPHGGPHGVRDDWFYDSDAQFLASRGYLVLQVNYRGSGGRGRAFKEAGYLKWGTRIQQDLIDGVHWAIDQHLADPQRICVYGGSFGGYSALMSVIRAPGLFKCAIDYAGVADLAMMYKKGDIRQSQSGRSYMKAVIGRDDAELAANSPDHLADKIAVPVFIAHGKADRRVPFAQAEAMRDAMDAAHKPYEWLAIPKEGHGFYKPENRAKFLGMMQDFLAKYIGKGAPVQP
jgi:dipeptidyl aminopeptidase/acylaminoacyl peptidase